MNKHYWMLLIASISLNAHANTIEYYRYQDESGNNVISSTIPPEFANQGYDIVSPRGNVLRHVPPKRTPAEIEAEKKQLAEMEKAKRLAEQTAEQQKEQAQKDKILLQMFSSVEDVERSRDQKLHAIKVLEGITEESISRQKEILEQEQQEADAIGQNGSVPEKLKERIEKTKANILDSEQFLKKKEKEKEEIHNQYQKLIERFKKIQVDAE